MQVGKRINGESSRSAFSGKKSRLERSDARMGGPAVSGSIGESISISSAPVYHFGRRRPMSRCFLYTGDRNVSVPISFLRPETERKPRESGWLGDGSFWRWFPAAIARRIEGGILREAKGTEMFWSPFHSCGPKTERKPRGSGRLGDGSFWRWFPAAIARRIEGEILREAKQGGEACTKTPFHQLGEAENLNSFRFLLKQAENLNSFRFLLKQAENPDLLANDPSVETLTRQETTTGEDDLDPYLEQPL
ncbi:hypothetical protein IEQ34_022132 [Dendrobium chrysotoxum]|uniref:Uncharacterized protein n=1 Tax=Dendrobium chrysotoxum TaxID=161865 RepID=A0AAV7FWS1_DENCH|nr:hypothetical protein IEQ34_022132 [Dendrobium chrysotoxum]